jgi:hypothetical protein
MVRWLSLLTALSLALAVVGCHTPPPPPPPREPGVSVHAPGVSVNVVDPNR